MNDHWVKCSEKLPAVLGAYLTFRPSGDGYSAHIGVAHYWQDGEWSPGEYIGPHAITHWMQLPKMPSADQDET